VEKRDLKKELPHLYRPSPREAMEVDVPSMSFLKVDGTGDPNGSQEYAEALEALFGLSYSLKFAVKKGPLAVDYGVLPLEGLWWADDMASFSDADRSAWKWTMMIRQPDLVTREMVVEAAAEVRRKKDPAALSRVRFETFAEGRAAQIMHIGPFADEGPAIERVHEFIERAGCRRSGKHHEIYLSDIRRADPAKWKTVIRQPMACDA
jgi:hypothetical protein